MYDVECVMKESSAAGKNIPMPTVDFQENITLIGMTGLLFSDSTSAQFLTSQSIITLPFQKRNQVE